MLNTRRGFRTAAQGETVGDNRAAVRIHKRDIKWTPLTRMLIDNGFELSRPARYFACSSIFSYQDHRLQIGQRAGLAAANS